MGIDTRVEGVRIHGTWGQNGHGDEGQGGSQRCLNTYKEVSKCMSDLLYTWPLGNQRGAKATIHVP